MYKPNMFSGSSYPPAYTPVSSSTIQTGRPINITKLDSTRSRWDKPFEIPQILYKKFNVPVPSKKLETSKPQGKSYPVQFLQFIERSYKKCSNQVETKHMEAELRTIMNQNEQKMASVNWKEFPTPKIPKTQSLPKSTSAPALVPMIIKANRINNVSQPSSSINPYVQPSRNQPPSTSFELPKFQFKSQPQKVQSLPKPKFPTSLIKGGLHASTYSQSKPRYQPEIEPKPHIGKFTQAPPPSKPIRPMTKSEQKNQKLQQKLNPPLKPLVIIQETNIAKRVERQSKFKLGPSTPVKQVVQYDEIQIDEDHKIIGTSQEMEKKYLRITSFTPDPSTVRPEHVLKKVLEFLRSKYKNGAPYEYVSQQFRSLRQDLLVQHIRNSFTVEVYEENTKISLFSDDMSQFHQCQSALWDLYKNGVYKTQKEKNKYIGFQILTLILDQKYRELEFMLTQLKADEIESEDVQSVLKVREMLTMGNYKAFFNFYNSRDTLTRCLLNQYIDKIRASCIAMFSKTLGEKVSVDYFAEIINDDALLLEQMITSIGGIVRDGFFYCKQSYAPIQDCQLLFKQKNRVTLTFN